MTQMPEYKSWVKMRERCNRPKDISYKNYGAKGIIVCDRWLNSFENFLSDMGLKPEPNYSIDRKDSTQNYNPDNCKWSSRIEQNNNKSDTRVIMFNGVKFNLRTFCAHLGMAQSTIYRRTKRKNISFDEAVEHYVNNCTQ